MGLFGNKNKAQEPEQSTGLIDLKKKAGISLAKNNLVGTKAAVYLVLDYSGSMGRYYRDGTVQAFTEQVLAIALNLDDDGDIPVTLFDNAARKPFTVTEDNYRSAVTDAVKKAGNMGTTAYDEAIKSVVAQHKASGATEPALVIFQTDGAPNKRRETEQAICAAAELPIFWQFVGFGRDRFEFLKKLDELAVPKKRVIDNAGFFEAGSKPKAINPDTLYDNLLGEFPDWLRQAKAQGIVR